MGNSWGDDYKVGVDSFDKLHESLFIVIDDLMNKIAEDGDMELIQGLFIQLGIILEEHFDIEEQFYFEDYCRRQGVIDQEIEQTFCLMGNGYSGINYAMMDCESILKKGVGQQLKEILHRLKENLVRHILRFDKVLLQPLVGSIQIKRIDQLVAESGL